MSDITLEKVAQFLYQEARFLDDEQWDEWLQCYAPTASFWMPAWDDDDQFTTQTVKVWKTVCSVSKLNVRLQPCQTHVRATTSTTLKLLNVMAIK